MKNKLPNTLENLERNFIAKASINSALALQMAQQLWNDQNTSDTQIADYVDLINVISKKLKDHCWQLNWQAHENFKYSKVIKNEQN